MSHSTSSYIEKEEQLFYERFTNWIVNFVMNVFAYQMINTLFLSRTKFNSQTRQKIFFSQYNNFRIEMHTSAIF